MFALNKLSIKKLTLIGFAFVALPLMIALLYSAAQVNQLSQQSAATIFSVEKLIKTNQEISEKLMNMERYISQYVVLKDEELLNNYNEHQQYIHNKLLPYLNSYNDKPLSELSQKFKNISLTMHKAITTMSRNALSLEYLQDKFKALVNLNQAMNTRSKQLLSIYVNNIQRSADHTNSMIIRSLFIIPISLLIAGFFIVLITKPLKRLIRNIHHLEQGDFETSITAKGSIEVQEIAEALELMRTRLHALELQKSSFIRHISHELKTPLAAIREGTELIYDNSVGQLNEEQQEICDIIRSSVTKLQQLIEDLLNFNIVLDSTSLQDCEKLEIVPIFDNTLSERKLDIKRKKIIVETNIESVVIQSNAKQLAVILDNLLSNAIKFTPENGTIKLNAFLKEQQLNIQITDTGTGITEQLQEKIFDAFYQGPAPEDSQIKGSGLGLTIVKELLMRLNGNISIISPVQSNMGTTINIRLPKAHEWRKSS
jgi:two-component system sensor histidine kinase GlrK